MRSICKLLEAKGLARIADVVHASVKRSVRLTATGKSQAARTRLGGRPNLPPEIEWPRWKGRPLAFVAQIELSSVPPMNGFDVPREGSLFFFHSAGQDAPWGYDPQDRDSAQVFYSAKPLGDLGCDQYQAIWRKSANMAA